MTDRPNWLPEEAVELFDVSTSQALRIIDKGPNPNRVLGRFKSLELAQQLSTGKNAGRATNFSGINRFWGVVVANQGYGLSTNVSRQPIMRSPRAAVINLLTEEERRMMNLVPAEPDVHESTILTLYDLQMQYAQGWVNMGRFVNRDDADIVSRCRENSNPQIKEAKYFVSGEFSYPILEPLPICDSPGQALIEEIAPEFRAILDI